MAKEIYEYERKKETREKKGTKEIWTKESVTQCQGTKPKLEAKPGKWDVQVIIWKGITVAEYIGPGLLGPTIEKFLLNMFDMQQINQLLKKF